MERENNDPMTKYVCPMHPNIKRDVPGMCPECGMQLVPRKKTPEKKNDTQPDKHKGHDVNIFAKKFWVSLILTIPILIYSPLPQELLGLNPPAFFGADFLPLILGSIIFFYGGWVFIYGAWREISGRMPGMMTLISMAIITAYTYSVVQTFRGAEETLFWELATLIVIMLLGHWLEMRAVKGAQGALKELSKLLPDTAEREVRDKTEIVALNALRVNDVIIVRPGGKIAADGEIIDGQSEVDEALATGESKPVSKKTGAGVIAGTINGNGGLKIKVTKIGDETFLAGVMRLVAQAQASKSKLQLLSDKAAFYLTFIALFSGVATLLIWLFLGARPEFAVTRLVAVLVIACPHALGLAIPLVASISTTMAAKNGFLVRERLALEAAREIDVVLFDKTGTLTKGEYGVTAVYPFNGDEKEVLKVAASIDRKSEHSVSLAIVKKAILEKISLTDVIDFKRLPGRGVSGIYDGREVKVGGQSLWDSTGLALSDNAATIVERENKAGKTVVFVISGEDLLGLIALGDVIRDESREAVKRLQDQGVQVTMITGDSKDVAAWVAGELGLKDYFAEVLPEQKADKVIELQKSGKKVAMVGDGINDAPALTQAEVGIAVGAGTNVAIESAGIVLVKNDPRDIPKIINLSRLTYGKMLQNLYWATGYNVFALPLAAGVAYSFGILLNPAVSAIFMSLSTIIVAFNAVLLRKKTI